MALANCFNSYMGSNDTKKTKKKTAQILYRQTCYPSYGSFQNFIWSFALLRSPRVKFLLKLLLMKTVSVHPQYIISVPSILIACLLYDIACVLTLPCKASFIYLILFRCIVSLLCLLTRLFVTGFSIFRPSLLGHNLV